MYACSMFEPYKPNRRTKQILITALAVFMLGTVTYETVQTVNRDQLGQAKTTVTEARRPEQNIGQGTALQALGVLAVKGRAPKTGYAREQFGAGWADINGCDMRNIILQRDLTGEQLAPDRCKVLNGTLNDPYTGKIIIFKRGATSSSQIQIDHVVSLGDAWQTGAQNLDIAERAKFANDPLNLLAVDGPTNEAKSDSDAASWLPPRKEFRCEYVARQIAVKRDYRLWVTPAEKSAMEAVLNTCPAQALPRAN